MPDEQPTPTPAPTAPKPAQPQMQQPKPTQAPAAAPMHKEARGIVRILGKDLKGTFELAQALPKIKGIGNNISHSLIRAIHNELHIEGTVHVGDLTDPQIQSIEGILKNPTAHGVKPYLVNRHKDPETGADRHTLQTDLQLALRNDVELERVMRSWIGWRGSIGQKVHGQHNRTTGRTGLTVGVLKKAIKSQKEAASKGAQDAGKKPEAKK